MDEDVGPVVELIQADQRRIDPEARVDPEGVRSRLVGLRSWSRRQLVVVPREPVSSAPEVVPVGWICVEDRAAGRSNRSEERRVGKEGGCRRWRGAYETKV